MVKISNFYIHNLKNFDLLILIDNFYIKFIIIYHIYFIIT
jgi:hypothetical protein